MRDATLRNYESWLRPFVRWLDDGVRQGRLDVTDHVLKTYLDERYRSGEYESYMRVGNQLPPSSTATWRTRCESSLH